jgi:hypothetical protein
MRVLFWFCDHIGWTPVRKTLPEAPDAAPGEESRVVAAFVHVEPADVEPGAGAETKLVKQAKWLARQWEVRRILLHSFTHLGEHKADPEASRALLERAQDRLRDAGYQAPTTPFGYFNDLTLSAPGHPLARIYKEW